MIVLALIFWSSLAIVGFAFAGYPLFLKVILPFFANRVIPSAEQSDYPSLSVVLIACDEESRIQKRIENLLECDYPAEKELVVVCDGCTDATAQIARTVASDSPIRVFEGEVRQGKAAGLNRGVGHASGDIVVFADARQRFDQKALVHLVAPFVASSSVAAVSGNLEIEKTEQGTGAGIDLYWKLERLIRHMESEIDSSIGCTGAIYALRRSNFDPIPEDTILDDVVIPMQALVRGGRILFEPKALAYDPQSLDPDSEKRRKVRTLAGNFQMLARYPEWLLPWKNRCWFQLLAHKYLRILAPFFMAACLLSNLLLPMGGSLFFTIALLAQVVCYSLGILGIFLENAKSRFLTIPAGFLFLQWQSVRGLAHYLLTIRKSRTSVWST